MIFDLRDVSFSYGAKQALNNLSLSIDSGLFYGILGPNGSGKTTLIDLLIRHIHPQSGQISFLGKPLNDYGRRHLAREIALMPQNFYINFPYTVAEVVMMGRYPHISRFSMPGPDDIERVNQIMAQTGLLAYQNRSITELSGGERQRVVFARALAQDAAVLMLDEATSNLDIQHSIRMLNLTRDLVDREGKTVVAVMQDINLAAMYCQRLILMKNAQLAVIGNTEDVLTPQNLEAVFHIQARVDQNGDAIQVIFSRKITS